jgi:ketosteroid isomerase-like protein
VDSEGARRVAESWVDAWNSLDPERVVALLHDDAVVADPDGGKVRAPDVAAHVRRRMAERFEPVRTWSALAGVDSVAVVCTMADGHKRADTLVLADDGRIVRVMVHT